MSEYPQIYFNGKMRKKYQNFLLKKSTSSGAMELYLTIATFCTNSADDKLMIFFSYFFTHHENMPI